VRVRRAALTGEMALIRDRRHRSPPGR
jgi:hypothetical protein